MSNEEAMKHYQFNNGGSQWATRGDCAIRAVAIALELDYVKVLNEFRKLMEGKYDKQPYQGTPKEIVKKFLKEKGWKWTPTMSRGSGCKVHLKPNELPSGRICLP